MVTQTQVASRLDILSSSDLKRAYASHGVINGKPYSTTNWKPFDTNRDNGPVTNGHNTSTVRRSSLSRRVRGYDEPEHTLTHAIRDGVVVADERVGHFYWPLTTKVCH